MSLVGCHLRWDQSNEFLEQPRLSKGNSSPVMPRKGQFQTDDRRLLWGLDKKKGTPPITNHLLTSAFQRTVHRFGLDPQQQLRLYTVAAKTVCDELSTIPSLLRPYQTDFHMNGFTGRSGRSSTGSVCHLCCTAAFVSNPVNIRLGGR